MQNKELIEKWLSNSLSKTELESFKKTNDYQALIKLDEALKVYKAPEFEVEKALASLQQKRKSETKVIKLSPLDTVLRIAAVVTFVLLGYLLILQDDSSTFSTGIGEKQLVSLPDQSTVRLNASSNLVYNSGEWDSNRTVDLTGEGYFTVAKGSKFDVNTKDGVITVLGTEFNVKSRETYFEVECYEGHVAVVANSDTVQLLAGNGVRFIEGQRILLNVSLSAPSWTDNESSFESVPYAEVIAEFERQFDVSIETKGVDLSKRFSGSFTHSEFEVALKSISVPLNLTIEKKTRKNITLSAIEE